MGHLPLSGWVQTIYIHFIPFLSSSGSDMVGLVQYAPNSCVKSLTGPPWTCHVELAVIEGALRRARGQQLSDQRQRRPGRGAGPAGPAFSGRGAVAGRGEQWESPQKTGSMVAHPTDRKWLTALVFLMG